MLPLTLLALAQPPEPTPPAPTATAVLTGEAVERPPLPAVGVGKFDLIVGVPFAVRYQHPLSERLWGEVGVGLYIIVPDVFAGARLDLGLHRGAKDCVAVRPGGGARLLVWPWGGFLGGSSATVAVPAVYGDVDFVWQRCWTDGPTIEVGVKLGVITAFGNRTGVGPIAGLMFGVRF